MPPIDALQDAGLRRRDLEVDLVGLELHQRIADATASPSLRSHFATRASTIDSPTSGTDYVRRH